MPDLSQLVARWGYLAIFLVVILGNMGLPVPEETVLAVAGYLVWAGRLRLLPVLIVGIVSAVAGDNLGYWLGRRYGRAAIERYARWLLLRPERVATARRFVTRYGPPAVFVGRFIAGLRFLAGPLAGAVGVPFRQFVVANFLGAAAFVPYAVGLGYAVGYGLGDYAERVRHVVGELGYALLIGGLILIALLVGGRVVKTLWRRRSP